MKKIINRFLVCTASLLIFSCTTNFDEINTDPQLFTEMGPEYLFSYACDRIPDGTSAWLYEDLEQYLRWSQLLTTETYEIGMNVHSRHERMYKEIFPNLFEVRRKIEAKPEKERAGYMKLWAATYVLQVYYALRVSDLMGSLPYTEIMQSRTNDMYSPKFDTQEELFEIFAKELTEANKIFQDGTEQTLVSGADVFYNYDWVKWNRLSNSLLIKLATRYENVDQAKAKQLFKQAVTDQAGVMSSLSDQLHYYKEKLNPVHEVEYRSVRYATNHVIRFMKRTNDIRMQMYFAKNDLTESALQEIKNSGNQLPSFIDINDPMIQYQGGQVNWSHPEAKWIKAPFEANGKKYSLISTLNRRFFAPRRDDAKGTFTDVLFSYAELCFYMAEYIQKGYAEGIDTKGTAEEWYERGITASITSMHEIAVRATSLTDMKEKLNESISEYLKQPDVKLDGNNNLEKIYIQQYLNFFRKGNEAFAFIRRTGYPKMNSTILKSEKLEGDIPRRNWYPEPTVDFYIPIWEKAQKDQGFTLRDHTEPVLAKERLWWDKNNPNYGEGK